MVIADKNCATVNQLKKKNLVTCYYVPVYLCTLNFNWVSSKPIGTVKEDSASNYRAVEECNVFLHLLSFLREQPSVSGAQE